MPKTGYFILHSNVMPPKDLTAGPYELVTTQTGLPFDVTEETTHIYVAAPRFTMPTEQIISTFPPANAEGAFGDRLPQIVLKRRTLPWERNPAEKPCTSTTPWLALVVVAEGEAQLSTATPVAHCVTGGTKLLDPETDKDVEQGLYLAVTETVVKKIFPCEEDLELLVHVREVDVNDTELANGDDDGWLAVVLANRLPVFDSANSKPVRYMACLLNVEGQLDALPKPEPPAEEFSFELAQDWRVFEKINPQIGPDPRVMGGMGLGEIVLPSADGVMMDGDSGTAASRATIENAGFESTPTVGAALDGASSMAEKPIGKQWQSATERVSAVALDPDAKRLVRDRMASGFRHPIEAFALEKVLRFPVLAHWSFTTNEGATFETLMQCLDIGLLGTVPAHDANGPGAPAPEVAETGHLELGHRSRRGDPLKAWYRGPCVPFPTRRDSATAGGLLPVAHASDQLRLVVPDGREDLSLAAAFEIGRLLAVSQLSVVSALLRFRNEQFGIGRIRELLKKLMPFEIDKNLYRRPDLGRFVALQMIEKFAKNPVQTLGPCRPVADPGRPLNVNGDLDQVIADGLGLDLAALRKAGEQVGMLAALAQTSVPLANRQGNIPFDTQAVTTLRDGLHAELNRVLNVAAPQQTIKSRVARQDGAPTTDALDELLERVTKKNDEEGLP